MKYTQSALVALQFLTQVPVFFKDYPKDKTAAASLIFYPLVGALIGLALVIVAGLSVHGSTLLSAALVLTFWVVITGALHLDGLADSCDAWIGGHGNKQRTLDIMQDPCSGPIAVVMLVCTLLVKFAAIAAILEASQYWLLLVAPLLARSLLPLLLLFTPYVRPQGIGSKLVKHAPRQKVYIACAAGIVLAYIVGSLLVLLVSCIALYGLRVMMIKRLEGLTGDTAGASIEIIESIALISLVFGLS